MARENTLINFYNDRRPLFALGETQISAKTFNEMKSAFEEGKIPEGFDVIRKTWIHGAVSLGEIDPNLKGLIPSNPQPNNDIIVMIDGDKKIPVATFGGRWWEFNTISDISKLPPLNEKALPIIGNHATLNSHQVENQCDFRGYGIGEGYNSNKEMWQEEQSKNTNDTYETMDDEER